MLYDPQDRDTVLRDFVNQKQNKCSAKIVHNRNSSMKLVP